MAITIPDNTKIRITTDFLTPMNGHSMPAMIATLAITNPGPIAVDPSNGPTTAGQVQAIQAAGAAGAGGYVGYNPDANIPAGGPVSPIRHGIIEGFSGVVAGSPVYIDVTGADNSSTASGLTHTQQGGNTVELDAGTISATSNVEIVVPAGVTTLAGLDLTVNTTVAANDTNYWTLTLTNLGTGGAGSTVMLAASGNASTATAGNGGFAAGVPTVAVLSATAANLVVVPGQVLQLTLTKTASAANLVDLTVRAAFTGNQAAGKQVGVGWATDRIFFS